MSDGLALDDLFLTYFYFFTRGIGITPSAKRQGHFKVKSENRYVQMFGDNGFESGVLLTQSDKLQIYSKVKSKKR